MPSGLALGNMARGGLCATGGNLSAKPARTRMQAGSAFAPWTPANRQIGRGWMAHQRKLAALAASVPPCGDGAVQPTGTFTQNRGAYSCTLMADGRVFVNPGTGTTAHIYDPAADTLTATASIGGTPPYGGSVLLPDGRIYLIPSGSGATAARIYTPESNSWSTPAGTFPGTANQYFVGVLLPDGRVFLGPRTTTNARIYDPTKDTLTVSTWTVASDAFHGGILLPDGRVFLMPYNSTTGRIWDPVTDTLTVTGGTFPGAGKVSSGLLLNDGRVYIPPQVSSTTALVYDPKTDTTTAPGGTFVSGSNQFIGGVLMADGRVFITPFTSTTARIYDPVTDSVVVPAGSYPGDTSGFKTGYVTGCLMQDGRVYVPPYNATSARIAGTKTGAIPQNRTTSPLSRS